MSITKQNPELLFNFFNSYSILEIEVLNENLKQKYIELANNSNNKLFINPSDEGKHMLFPILCSNDLMIPIFNNNDDIVFHKTEIKLKKTLFFKQSGTLQSSNTISIRLIKPKTNLKLFFMMPNKYNGVLDLQIMNSNETNAIKLNKYDILLNVESPSPMFIKIVDSLNNVNCGQPCVY